AARRRPRESIRIAADQRDDLETPAGAKAGYLDASPESSPHHGDADLFPAHGHTDPNCAASTMRPVKVGARLAASDSRRAQTLVLCTSLHSHLARRSARITQQYGDPESAPADPHSNR